MNALCLRACFRDPSGRDRNRPITEVGILNAQEQLILKRVVHLDQLADKLREDRVRRVIEPLLSGADYQPEPSMGLDRLTIWNTPETSACWHLTTRRASPTPSMPRSFLGNSRRQLKGSSTAADLVRRFESRAEAR